METESMRPNAKRIHIIVAFNQQSLFAQFKFHLRFNYEILLVPQKVNKQANTAYTDLQITLN